MQSLGYTIHYVLSTINPFFKLIRDLVKTDVSNFDDLRLVSFSIRLLRYFYSAPHQSFRYGVDKFTLIINTKLKLQWL